MARYLIPSLADTFQGGPPSSRPDLKQVTDAFAALHDYTTRLVVQVRAAHTDPIFWIKDTSGIQKLIKEWDEVT